ncbi:hypothetical protein PPYR_05331 [Photinus pyralis]|uniref:Transposase domain-containing protein n=1 Tax=Photinus pyralis TaxID=7054 RepID=A0A1Y1LGK9_PHOPY|nr:uncharacterized protein LOC116161644 [Photinus pyralis]XP_031335399.1 uncharacterized protein LOC116165258 isoform X1 [Photinus pyralis]XP_031335400.1 uncharacterized protein LOC116165258 isoform X1 [Photinus pyralis]XP_031337695.1 uncharacterized protein LOC116166744 isoform X1 [Photinus pyralis]XP_031350203.1 uncharacterized protein LOC116175955 isoform X1 [Photinus pyralis]XP_031358190.1 uncharacterized protein LOC116181889 isoform X1 [Photinus pyralis]XP_031358191.1 uncharacterized pro
MDSEKRKLFNKLYQRYKRSKQVKKVEEEPSTSKDFDYCINSESSTSQKDICNVSEESTDSELDFCDIAQIPSKIQEENFVETEFLNDKIEDKSEQTGHGVHKFTLIEQLSDWAIIHNIDHFALSDLLRILNQTIDINLPKDPRTILKTPRNTGSLIEKVEPGVYFHFGVENCLINLLNRRDVNDSEDRSNILEICVNVDGLPLSKSSGSQLWPIMINLFQNKNIVEVCGLYQGNKKPENANVFMSKFVNEIISLMTNGFTYKSQIFFVKIKAFICDVPAKAFIKCTRGHSGYMSCSKCDTEGVFKKNRICFPAIEGFHLRTDATFRRKEQDSHHTDTSILESIPNLNMITCFPLDYMHLVCLGIVKKLISNLWLSGKPPYRFSSQQISEVSQKHLSLQNQVPTEFSRKPRLLSDIKHWKATELRMFLFYTGPVILKESVTNEIYQNFMSLHVAVTLFSKSQNIDYAAELSKYFIQTFSLLYGEENISHNVHNLLHIVDDVKMFGSLENFSAFPFENNMLFLKKLVRKGDRPLQQIVNRIVERNKCVLGSGNIRAEYPVLKYEHSNGPLIASVFGMKQFKKIYIKNFLLALDDSNNCCFMNDNSVVIIKNIVSLNNVVTVIGQKYLVLENLYNLPCESSKLNIFVVSKEGPIKSWELPQVLHKFFKLTLNNKVVVFPLLHTTA